MERFTEKDIFCLGCGENHTFDMFLKQVACPKQYPYDYPRIIKFEDGTIMDDVDEVEIMNYEAAQEDQKIKQRSIENERKGNATTK